MAELTFPAVFILSRAGHHWKPPARAFVDDRILCDETALMARGAQLQRTNDNAARLGGIVYTLTPCPVETACARAEELQAELTAMLAFATVALKECAQCPE